MGVGECEERRMVRVVKIVGAFMVVMGICTVVCTIVWSERVQDVLYHCTDSVPGDYLSGPSHWVHGKVVGGTEDYGDWIKPGWTMGELEALWGGMWVGSVVVSGGAAWGVGRLWRGKKVGAGRGFVVEEMEGGRLG